MFAYSLRFQRLRHRIHDDLDLRADIGDGIYQKPIRDSGGDDAVNRGPESAGIVSA